MIPVAPFPCDAGLVSISMRSGEDRGFCMVRSIMNAAFVILVVLHWRTWVKAPLCDCPWELGPPEHLKGLREKAWLAWICLLCRKL